ncbi:TPA: FRG domain-containing protein [Vibrio parahaemolyticus]
MFNQWEVKEAFAEITVECWGDLVYLLEASFLDWSEFIFRGQADSDWTLRSKFDRDYKNMLSEISNYNSSEASKIKGLIQLKPRHDLLKEHLSRFKTNTVGRRGASPTRLNDMEWWSLGQHFGLSTPLLDWSRSPYVSLYFSLISQTLPESGYHALWVFSPAAFHDLHINQDHRVESEDESIRFIHDALCEENQRVISQGGVFTLTPNGEDIDEFIPKVLNLNGHAPVLYKIKIPMSNRDDFLRHLESMNVHSGTLFPDLIGAADLANRQLEKEKTLLLRRKSDSFADRLFSLNLYHETPNKAFKSDS